MRDAAGQQRGRQCRVAGEGGWAADKGMPLPVIQEIMDHTDSATTSIYVKAREKRIAQAAAKYYADDKADPE